MSKASTVLACIALAGSGYVAWSTGTFCKATGACERPESDEVATLTARVHALEEQLAAGHAPAPLPAPHTSSTGGADSTDLASAPKPLPAPPVTTSPPPTADAVAALEKRLATLEETEKARPKLPTFLSSDGSSSHSFAMPKMYGSVADAATDLDLSPRQKDDFDRIVADAKREMTDLKNIPNADGKTWSDVEKEMLPKISEGKFDLSAMMGFQKGTIPGRNETYGQARKRIQDGARAQMRDTLTPDQQKKFEGARTDPLIGGGANTITASFVTTTSTDDAAMK